LAQLGTVPVATGRKDRYKASRLPGPKLSPDQDQSATGIDKVLQAARLNTYNSQPFARWQTLSEGNDGQATKGAGIALAWASLALELRRVQSASSGNGKRGGYRADFETDCGAIQKMAWAESFDDF
jgi:hypothetical protein